MKHRIIIIAEHFGGKLNPVTYQLASFARELSTFSSLDPHLVILGDAVERYAHEIAYQTGFDVTAVEVPGLASYNAEVYVNVLGELIPGLDPVYVCCAHTSQGMDFAPRLAVRLGAACITSVECLHEEGEQIRFARAIYGGKIVANVVSGTQLTVITVLPGAFPPPELDNTEPGLVILSTIPSESHRSRSLETKLCRPVESVLADARVIVSAGRGIGKKENLSLLEKLASVFPRSAVAGSRRVCDVGWLEYNRQIGLTGATVTPELYIACGVSGAVQHVAGMRDSGFVVAVNNDKHAAIFNVADVCIVEDLTTFIPLLVDECLLLGQVQNHKLSIIDADASKR